MSWTCTIPKEAHLNGGVERERILEAIEQAEVDVDVYVELAPGPQAQLDVAKAAAREIVQSSTLTGKCAFAIRLSGHCDPGDRSTAQNCITVSVEEVR